MINMAAQSLDLVSDELTTTLEEARGELEKVVDGQAGPKALSRCADLLHQTRGALKIAEIHGGVIGRRDGGNLPSSQ